MYYTWEHPEYRDFMMKILNNLMARQEKAGEILFHENDEVNEILFIMKGCVDVGFTQDRDVKYVLRFIDKILLAAYNATFNIKTVAAYRCFTRCSGFSLKKKCWENIIDDKFTPNEIRNHLKE